MISIDPEIYSELQVRLAKRQSDEALAVAELMPLPPTRPQGAKRMSLPDEGDGLRSWSEAEAAEVVRG